MSRSREKFQILVCNPIFIWHSRVESFLIRSYKIIKGFLSTCQSLFERSSMEISFFISLNQMYLVFQASVLGESRFILPSTSNPFYPILGSVYKVHNFCLMVCYLIKDKKNSNLAKGHHFSNIQVSGNNNNFCAPQRTFSMSCCQENKNSEYLDKRT